jgi:hypothetical protein
MLARFSAVGTLLAVLLMTGCGGQSATVSGRVTCDGKPVVGSIMFSPKGDSPENTGPAVEGVLDSDGKYTVQLKSIGSHRVRVSPGDIPYPPIPGKEYPCDLSTLDKDVKSGTNEISIELAKRKK